MSYYVTNENSVLNINNAHLKVSGNIQTDVMKLGAIEFAPATYPPESDVPGTVNFTNVTTGVTTSSNLNVGGTLMLGSVELVTATAALEQTVNLGNVTSNTVQFTNATTSLVASGNVEVGGNVVAGYLYGDGSNITGISSNLDQVVNTGNVTSNTVQFSNAITGFVTTANIEVGGNATVSGNAYVSSNIEVAGFVGSSGTGALTVPSGTEAQRPTTGVLGMIRYNTEATALELYNGTAWTTVENHTPLYTFTSHTFTNAGATGRLGPTFADMKSHYSSTVWEQNPAWFNEISGKQGFQLWTVPVSGTFRITVNGGRGGDTTSTHSGNNQPGPGAQIRADFALTKGTKLVIIVGQSARTAEYTSGEAAGGGGGGTWVLKENFTTSTNDIYMVAGGGAGQANYSHSGLTAASGGTSQASVSDTGGGETSQGDTMRNAGGGAGWGSNGLGTGSQYPGVQGQDTGGYKPSVGAMGGDYTYGTPTWDGQGGFGGGGSSSIQVSGGGGGFSGGNAAWDQYASSSWGHAQGGTSYIMPNGTGGVIVTNRVFVGTHGNREGSVYIQAPGTF